MKSNAIAINKVWETRSTVCHSRDPLDMQRQPRNNSPGEAALLTHYNLAELTFNIHFKCSIIFQLHRFASSIQQFRALPKQLQDTIKSATLNDKRDI